MKEKKQDFLQTTLDNSGDLRDTTLLGGLDQYQSFFVEEGEIGKDVIPSWPSSEYKETEN